MSFHKVHFRHPDFLFVLQAQSFVDVKQYVCTKLISTVTPDANFGITYTDSDNDVITISSEIEFQEALESIRGSNTPIKLIVKFHNTSHGRTSA